MKDIKGFKIEKFFCDKCKTEIKNQTDIKDLPICCGVEMSPIPILTRENIRRFIAPSYDITI